MRCRTAIADTDERLQAACWNDAPPEVLKRIMQSLPAKERWKSRRLCSSWASVARREARFEVTVTVSSTNLLAKLRTLSRHVDFAAYPNVRFRQNVSNLLVEDMCARILARVKLQITQVILCQKCPLLQCNCFGDDLP